MEKQKVRYGFPKTGQEGVQDRQDATGKPNEGQDRGDPVIWNFKIYVAGAAPNSLRAIANLYAILRQYLPDKHSVEIIDVLEDPLVALRDGILVTPTLVKLTPLPVRKLLGSLDDRETVLAALGLGGGKWG
jgi:circadian clock protein KaiB